MKAIEILKDKFNTKTNFFILDSHDQSNSNVEENSHNDIDFKYYSYNTKQHNKISEGDLFIYRKPSNSRKDKKFFFYGLARIKKIERVDESGNVKAILDLGYKFKEPIYQGCDFLEKTMKWTFKTKGSNWRNFFTQYGMTHINKHDFLKLLENTELYPISNMTSELTTLSNIKYNLVYEPIPKSEFKIEEGKKYWKRNPDIVTNVLMVNKYLCEYDINHKYFISQKTNNNYVEGHHLVPMRYQDNFIYSLDTEANVTSLCPICHKILHFGRFEDKVDILKQLYEERKEKLLLTAIDIKFDELLNLYK